MSVNYQGKSVQYDKRTNTYSRARVPIYRICKHGFKRELLALDQGCPCYKCSSQNIKEGATPGTE